MIKIPKFKRYKRLSFDFNISAIGTFIVLKMYIMFTMSMLVILKLSGVELTVDVLELYNIILTISFVELIIIVLKPVGILVYNLIVFVKKRKGLIKGV